MAKRFFIKNSGLLIAVPTLIFFWYTLHIIMDSKVIPSPFVVFVSIPAIMDENMLKHLFASLYRVTLGIFFSIIIGVTIGVLMGTFKKFDKVMQPIIYLTYPIPKLALLPIIILTFGLKETSKVTMIVLIIVFQVITSIRSAVLNVPKSNYNYFKILGINKFKTFIHIVVPVIAKQLFVTLKIGVGTAISVLFFTETYGTLYGLGYFIMDNFQTADYVEMYIGIVMLSFIGFTIFILLDLLEEIFTPW